MHFFPLHSGESFIKFYVSRFTEDISFHSTLAPGVIAVKTKFFLFCIQSWTASVIRQSSARLSNSFITQMRSNSPRLCEPALERGGASSLWRSPCQRTLHYASTMTAQQILPLIRVLAKERIRCDAQTIAPRRIHYIRGRATLHPPRHRRLRKPRHLHPLRRLPLHCRLRRLLDQLPLPYRVDRRGLSST